MAQKKPTVYEFIPKLGKLRDEVLFGDVWEHPDLSKRDRSLITVAMLAALYRTDEMRGHMQRALDNGVTQTELKGLITHVAFYAGWPCAVNAGRIAIEVFGPKCGQEGRRHRPRAGPLPEVHRAPRGPDLGRERGGKGLDLPVHVAGQVMKTAPARYRDMGIGFWPEHTSSMRSRRRRSRASCARDSDHCEGGTLESWPCFGCE